MGDLNIALFNYMEFVESERKHLAGGISGHGSCIARQAYQKAYSDEYEFGNHGALVPGTAFHVYWQTLLPSGTVLKDENDIPTWLIIGHEQYVFFSQEGLLDRKSPIDTLVYNLISKEYEIWDYKSTRTDMRYIRRIEPKDKMQINFYAYKFSEAWELDYYPICRVIYGEKVNWNNLKQFDFRCDAKLYKKSIKYINMVNELIPKLRSETWTISPKGWEKYATGLDYWSATKKPYRSQCRYCKFNDKCLTRLGYGSIEDYDEREK